MSLFGGREFICSNPNCGHVGQGNRKAKGSSGCGCLIFICALVLGVVFYPGGLLVTAVGLLVSLYYFATRAGYIYSCRKCGIELSRD